MSDRLMNLSAEEDLGLVVVKLMLCEVLVIRVFLDIIMGEQ